MGCSTSTQTLTQEGNRPGVKPAQSNGANLSGPENGQISAESATLPDPSGFDPAEEGTVVESEPTGEGQPSEEPTEELQADTIEEEEAVPPEDEGVAEPDPPAESTREEEVDDLTALEEEPTAGEDCELEPASAEPETKAEEAAEETASCHEE
ncbi:fibrous sheath CABYR-binding protein-like [Erpetoichthys calabaricus]|uniref:fibrous sheath CABYR-binding protein-like n=1 Tax=Erpetoichthys calabaricus TaxID=27687 RepID=UPI0022341CDE|nr:fibrous sheath CABYR-binding protein-like [Erpetoichthys calabaricus]